MELTLADCPVGTQEQDLSPEDAHYSETVSSVLRHNLKRWVGSSPFNDVIQSQKSAFSRWSSERDRLPVCSRGSCISQWLLKSVVLNIRDLHCKLSDGSSPKSTDGEGGNRFQKGAAQEEISANHVLAERRRREKLNERFMILRSLVPFVTKACTPPTSSSSTYAVDLRSSKAHMSELRSCRWTRLQYLATQSST